jgi:hypothetical protein
MPNAGTRAIVVLAAAGLVLGATGQARQRGGGGAPAAGAPPRLSGYWELAYDSLRIPPANLAPGVTRAAIDQRAARDRHAARWCHTMGLPIAMLLGRPIEVRVGLREAYIVFEAHAAVRHIYLNRTAHINPDEFDPSTSGDSIGRWEGETFVVETVGFHGDRGITAIPGGGFRTAGSRLTERFRLRRDGTVLSVTSTWTDPKVFRTPHTYEARYYRLPDNYEPRPAIPCDAYDAERVAYVESGLGAALPAANARAAGPAATPARGGRRGTTP